MFALYVTHGGIRLFAKRGLGAWTEELQFAKFFPDQDAAAVAADKLSKKTLKPIGRKGGWAQKTRITRLTPGEAFELIKHLQSVSDNQFKRIDQFKTEIESFSARARGI